MSIDTEYYGKLVGKQFGRLCVVGKSFVRKYGKPTLECMCSCGRIVFVNVAQLNRGDNRSCGRCIYLEKRTDTQTRFERQYTPEPNTGCWLWLGSLSKKGERVSVLAREYGAAESTIFNITNRRSWQHLL